MTKKETIKFLMGLNQCERDLYKIIIEKYAKDKKDIHKIRDKNMLIDFLNNNNMEETRAKYNLNEDYFIDRLIFSFNTNLFRFVNKNNPKLFNFNKYINYPITN
jgi:hypothetical protein